MMDHVESLNLFIASLSGSKLRIHNLLRDFYLKNKKLTQFKKHIPPPSLPLVFPHLQCIHFFICSINPLRYILIVKKAHLCYIHNDGLKNPFVLDICVGIQRFWHEVMQALISDFAIAKSLHRFIVNNFSIKNYTRGYIKESYIVFFQSFCFNTNNSIVSYVIISSLYTIIIHILFCFNTSIMSYIIMILLNCLMCGYCEFIYVMLMFFLLCGEYC